MRKELIVVHFFLCILCNSAIKSQSFRNNFIGAYYSKAIHYNTNISSTVTAYQIIYVLRDNSDSAKIFVADSGANPPPSHNVNLHTDSTFKDTIWCTSGTCYYGKFHYLDSIFYHKVEYGIPGVWTDFYGKKTSLSGINALDVLNSSLIIYPNPCENKLFLKNISWVEVKKIALFTIDGKELLFNFPISENIDVSHLPTGMYFLKLYANEGVLTRKIIIERH